MGMGRYELEKVCGTVLGRDAWGRSRYRRVRGMRDIIRLVL